MSGRNYLNEAKARQLIERPVQEFVLRYEPDASLRVLDLTRGHPFLVQLLCAEIVVLKNEQDLAVRRLVRLIDVEGAVPGALSSGSLFFADIERNQVNAAGLTLLRFIAAQGEGAVVQREALTRHVDHPAELDRALALLIRRELIEICPGSTFPAPLDLLAAITILVKGGFFNLLQAHRLSDQRRVVL